MVVENKRKADESALVPAKKTRNEVALSNNKNKAVVQPVKTNLTYTKYEILYKFYNIFR